MHNPALCIDVLKSTSFANPFVSLNQTSMKPFSFSHDQHGLNLALKALHSLEASTGTRPDVVVEAAGNYSKPLVNSFYEHGYNVVVLNPLVTSLHKRKSLRKLKTDPQDTYRITKVYYMNDYRYYKPLSRSYKLKLLSRQWQSLTDSHTEIQLKFRSLLDLVFPGYSTVFSSLYGKTSLSLIESYPTPAAVLDADTDSIMQILKSGKQPQLWCESKLQQLLSISRESLALSSSKQSLGFCLVSYIDFLRFYNSKMTDIRAHMIDTAQKLPEFTLLKSIPGIGDLTATTILGEIDDIHNFKTSKQLVAYAGLDPSVHQSGSFTASNNKISKRGTPYLRKALYQAAKAGITKRKTGIKNLRLYDFHKKKLDEGKAPNVAMVATAHKLLNIIFAMLTNGELYDPAH